MQTENSDQAKPAIAPSAEKQPAQLGRTVSMNFKSDQQKARFQKVFEHRQKRNPKLTMSEFLWSLFEYVEHNPYGDFSTGN